MRTGSYVGRIYKTFNGNPTAAEPVFTIPLPNYACEVRFKVEGSSKNTFAYSFDPKYNTPTVVPNDVQLDNTLFSLQVATDLAGFAGLQTTKEVVWRHADNMPNALFIVPMTTGSSGQMICSYSIIGGKNHGY